MTASAKTALFEVMKDSGNNSKPSQADGRLRPIYSIPEAAAYIRNL